MFTGKDFENMGKAAAKEYVSSNKPLNDSITKIAEHYGLNPAQTARVVEQANVETYLKLNEASDDKYVEFEPANSKTIASNLSYNVEKNAALATEYSDIMADIEYSVDSDLLDEDKDRIKEAEDLMIKKAQKDFIAAIDRKLEEVDVAFSRESTELYNLVKQASLESGSFGLVKQAMVAAVPDATTGFIADAYKVKLKKEAARINFDDVDSPRGVLNNNHPVVQSLLKMSVLRDEYVELKELKKEAVNNFRTLATGLGQTVEGLAGLAGEGIKSLTTGAMRHKYLITGGVLGGAGLAIGRAKGRSETSKANVKVNQEYVERAKANRPL